MKVTKVKVENKEVSNIKETRYSTMAIYKLKKFVDVVTVDSKQALSHIDYNNWTNHSEYSKGY